MIKALDEYTLGEAIELVLDRQVDFCELDDVQFTDVLIEAFNVAFSKYRCWAVRNEGQKLRKHIPTSKCENCGASDTDLEVHHIVPVALGGSNAEDNIQYLCRNCHILAHKRNA